jgi:hypothetical protein
VNDANPGQADNELDGLGDDCDLDDDNDDLVDLYETNTGTLVSQLDTGSDPLVADSDNDGWDDGAEVAMGFDPNNPSSHPPSLPSLSVGGRLLLLGSFLVLAFWMRRKRGST